MVVPGAEVGGAGERSGGFSGVTVLLLPWALYIPWPGAHDPHHTRSFPCEYSDQLREDLALTNTSGFGNTRATKIALQTHQGYFPFSCIVYLHQIYT